LEVIQKEQNIIQPTYLSAKYPNTSREAGRHPGEGMTKAVTPFTAVLVVPEIACRAGGVADFCHLSGAWEAAK